jgi:hypothetical protein
MNQQLTTIFPQYGTMFSLPQCHAAVQHPVLPQCGMTPGSMKSDAPSDRVPSRGARRDRL